MLNSNKSKLLNMIIISLLMIFFLEFLDVHNYDALNKNKITDIFLKIDASRETDKKNVGIDSMRTPLVEAQNSNKEETIKEIVNQENVQENIESKHETSKETVAQKVNEENLDSNIQNDEKQIDENKVTVPKEKVNVISGGNKTAEEGKGQDKENHAENTAVTKGEKKDVVQEYIKPVWPTAPAHSNGCYMGKYCNNYILQPKNFCPAKKTLLVIYVFSMERSFASRKLIRETWADKSIFDESYLKVFFILALSNDRTEELKRNLTEESEKHNDIVIDAFGDHFVNLTLKSLSGINWSIKNCPNASFVLKTDDDMLLNTYTLLRRLVREAKAGNNKLSIIGYLWHKPYIQRYGQYKISTDAISGTFWPNFCSGSGYIMSMDSAKLLHQHALADNRTVYIHIDDPYITGILAERAGIKRVAFYSGYLLFEDAQLTKKPSWYTEERWKLRLTEVCFWHIHDSHYTHNKDKTQDHRDIWAQNVKMNGNKFSIEGF